jgi:hypothetical protein
MSFRGSRSYLHSTDLYETLLRACKESGLGTVDGPISLKIRRKLERQPRFELYEPDEEPMLAGCSAEFTAAVAGRTVVGSARESDRPVTQRTRYNETLIWDRASIAGETITLREQTGATAIEVITALAVLHHRTLLPPAAEWRWMLSRLGLARPLVRADAAAVKITLRRQLGGQMTRSDITVRGDALGSLEFVLARS